MINWEEFGAGWRLKPPPVKERSDGDLILAIAKLRLDYNWMANSVCTIQK